MKKYILTALMMISFALPSLASCPITGFCAPDNSVFSDSDITDKYLPNHLNQIQKPTAFTPEYHQPFDDMLINTDQPQSNTSPMSEESSYDANCQFGVCLPGALEN